MSVRITLVEEKGCDRLAEAIEDGSFWPPDPEVCITTFSDGTVETAVRAQPDRPVPVEQSQRQ